MKLCRHLEQQEIECTKSEDRKDVGRVDDKPVGRNAKDGRYRIHGENKIGHIDNYQYQEKQGADAVPVDVYKKCVAVIFLVNPHELRRKADYRAFLGVKRFILTEHL